MDIQAGRPGATHYKLATEQVVRLIQYIYQLAGWLLCVYMGSLIHIDWLGYLSSGYYVFVQVGYQNHNMHTHIYIHIYMGGSKALVNIPREL
ncbi:hypothetical protein BJX64DRAFT_266470 [Aspergillus heterothallicus]